MSNTTSTFGHIKQRNLPDRIADHLVAGIAKGEIRPGQRLREVELCRALGISRIPLREALRILQAQGVLTTTPNLGTFVAEFDSSNTADMLEIRINVERAAFTRVLLRAQNDRGILSRVEEKLDELRLVARFDDKFLYARADLAFHECIVEMSGSPMLTAVWRSLARRVLFFMLQEKLILADCAGQVRDHERLLDLLRSGTVEGLEREVGSHILRHVTPDEACIGLSTAQLQASAES